MSCNNEFIENSSGYTFVPLKVINISENSLTKNTISTLERGLKFCLPQTFNAATFELEKFQFIRKLRFKFHFKDEEQTHPVDPLIQWTPTYSDPPQFPGTDFESYTSLLEKRYITSHTRKISQPLRTTNRLKELKNIRNLKFCRADKGGTLVIMNTTEYINMVEKHLGDTNTYQRLESNIDNTIQTKILDLVNEHKPCFSPQQYRYLVNHDFQHSYFYVLPKVHKSTIILSQQKKLNTSYIQFNNVPEDLESRPIISNINSPTSRLSYFLDNLLKPIVTLIHGYIKNSVDLLSKIPRTVDKNTVFLSMDVKSLYTNIDHDIGNDAIHYWINKYFLQLTSLNFNIPCILEMLNIVLKYNTFKYDKNDYIQLRGTAMGTRVAPTYAHLVMAFLEIKIFAKCRNIYGERNTEVIKNNYWRYLDDIFCIWNPNVGDPSMFVKLFNTTHKSIQVTHTVHPTKVHFLDLTIMKDTNGNISTDIFYKPTDSHSYLHFHSNHPRHIKRNIPYCLAYRINSLVSDNTMKEMRFRQLNHILGQLKYPQDLVENAIGNARSNIRRTMQIPKNSNNLPFIFTHYPESTQYFENVFRPVLSPISDNFFKKGLCIYKSLRQPANLYRSLCTKTNNFSVKKCGRARCKTCPILMENYNHIYLNNHEIVFNKNMTCETMNVIYILFCNTCPNLFYVGETSLPLNLRVNLHRSQIKHEEYCILKVSKHIRECGEGFKILPIYTIPTPCEYFRKKLEEFYIHTLQPALNC